MHNIDECDISTFERVTRNSYVIDVSHPNPYHDVVILALQNIKVLCSSLSEWSMIVYLSFHHMEDILYSI